MKVLLADLPLRDWGLDASYPNMGLLYLLAYLRSTLSPEGVEVRYLDARHNLGQHIAAVREFQPDLYGLSLSSLGMRHLPTIVSAVRQAVPHAAIICGGPGPTAEPELALASEDVDLCVIGEGEETLREVVEVAALGSRAALAEAVVAGTAVRSNGDVVKLPPRRPIADLDELPFPAWDAVDLASYPGMFLKRASPETNVLVSRGCPFDCCFCSNPVWKASRPWLRSRSPEDVAEEVEWLYQRGVREVYLASDELNFSEQRALDLCEALASLGHKDLYFQCNMRAHPLSDELARALARMNCWLVHLGIESANDRVLAGIGKHVTVAQIEEACARLSRHGIRVFAFMMLYQAWEENGRLAWETTDEVENSLRFTRRMFRQGTIHYMSWQFCTPLPGSRLYGIAQRHGLLPHDLSGGYEHRVNMRLPGIEAREMQRMLRKGILLKDWYILRSGALSLRHLGRVWENLRSAVGR